MFNKLTTLVFLLPLVSALQLNPPNKDLTTEGSVTITWTTTSTDPGTFDLRLTNDAFHATYAVKATVQTADLKLTFEMPVVEPGPNYSIQATAVGDVNNILSEIGPFTVGAALSTTSSSTSSSSSSGLGGSSAGGPGSSSSTPVVGGPPTSSSSGFGHTVGSSSPTSSPSGTGNSVSAGPSSSGSSGGAFNGSGSGALATGPATLVGTLGIVFAAGLTLVGL